MRNSVILVALVLALSGVAAPATAKGCIKGAIVGGAAGHYAHHHGVLGAAAGCLIGRHYAHKHTRKVPEPRLNDSNAVPAQVQARRALARFDGPGRLCGAGIGVHPHRDVCGAGGLISSSVQAQTIGPTPTEGRWPIERGC